jgi:hypothetical protein
MTLIWCEMSRAPRKPTSLSSASTTPESEGSSELATNGTQDGANRGPDSVHFS